MNIFDAFLVSHFWCTDDRVHFKIKLLYAVAFGYGRHHKRIRQATAIDHFHSSLLLFERTKPCTGEHQDTWLPGGIENVEPREIKMYCSRRKSLQQYHLLFKPIEHIFCVSVCVANEEAKKKNHRFNQITQILQCEGNREGKKRGK